MDVIESPKIYITKSGAECAGGTRPASGGIVNAVSEIAEGDWSKVFG